ncbi:uncharacterized protein LOC141697348 [Apium graveolens]|uniref:uncharacterized protein LOC141697348 n=1 Tax=Apium graveolens TaxID=4045 RepID=UPI003D7A550F
MEVDGRPDLGGMEKAFSINIMMRLVEFFAGRLIVDLFRGAAPTTKERKQKKTCRRLGNRVWGAWDSLPNELLVSVLMKLSLFDYLAVCGVCRSWRSVSIDIRKKIIERQKPLVFAKPKYSKKACVLYNMFDGKTCKAMLKDLIWDLVGLSCGYLIMNDGYRGFWLVNLMTRHELHFPVLPGMTWGILDYQFRAVLFVSTQLSRFFTVLFSRNHNFLLLSESGASGWQEYFLPNTNAGISDVKILDGKIFVLTCDGHFGEFNPKADPVLKLYNIKVPFQLSSQLCSQLVTSDNKLYVITYEYSMTVRYLSFYELDPKIESIKQINDLGSKSLFLSEFNSSVVDTTGWGAGNCVCVLDSYTLNRCSFFHLNGNKLATTPLYWNGHLKPFFWYIPGESCNISCVSDEFGT